MSARPAHSVPLVARLTAPLLKRQRRPFKSLLRSERRTLAKVRGLPAHDPFSLKPGAASVTLSVNALGYRISQAKSPSQFIPLGRSPQGPALGQSCSLEGHIQWPSARAELAADLADSGPKQSFYRCSLSYPLSYRLKTKPNVGSPVTWKDPLYGKESQKRR